MTERLYYTNAYLTAFDAAITQIRAVDGRTQVALDRSAFYPSSGGQPNDTGRLEFAGESQPVVDVLVEDGTLWHVLEGDAPPAGAPARGAIDWPRRYDHMQQHSGQHLLSQVFERLYGYETVSVHIGAGDNTLDLDTPSLDAAQIEAAETLCMEKVYAALPISAYFVDETQVAALALRRPPKVSGTIRIVEIDAYDFSACGGTHCRTTAELGPIKITATEKRRGIVRVSFLCGGRAWADYRRQHALLGQVAALYSSDRAQAPALAERTLAAAKESQRRIDDLTARLVSLEAVSLREQAEPVAGLPGVRVLSLLRDDLDPAGLRALASALIAEPGLVALLGSVRDGKLLLAFARGAEGVPQAFNMGALLKAALLEVGGSGGGRPDFAQGGGVDGSLGPRVLAFARAALS